MYFTWGLWLGRRGPHMKSSKLPTSLCRKGHWPQDPTNQADHHIDMKPNRKSSSYKVQHVRLTVVEPQSPTHQTDSIVQSSKPNMSY